MFRGGCAEGRGGYKITYIAKSDFVIGETGFLCWLPYLARFNPSYGAYHPLPSIFVHSQYCATTSSEGVASLVKGLKKFIFTLNSSKRIAKGTKYWPKYFSTEYARLWNCGLVRTSIFWVNLQNDYFHFILLWFYQNFFHWSKMLKISNQKFGQKFLPNVYENCNFSILEAFKMSSINLHPLK